MSQQNIAALKAQLALTKNSVKKLEKMKEAVGSRDCDAVEDACAEKKYKRKFLFWNCFTFNELPNEIITEIFRFIILSASDTNRITEHRLLLTSVCRFWRQLALDDNILWNTIYFEEDAPWLRSLTWFERAGGAPLDIRVDEPRMRPRKRIVDGPQLPTPPSMTPEQMDFLLDVLFAKYDQLRIMIFVLDRWDTAQVALRRFSSDRVPEVLERFELHRGSPIFRPGPHVWIPEPHNAADVIQAPALCNGFTPKLTWLCLSGININWTQFSSPSLTTLDLRRIPQLACPSSEAFRKILAASPRLRRLSLSMAGPQLANPLGFEPIPLPALRELLIGDCSVDYATTCLSQFTAPHLLNITMLNMTHIDFSSLLSWMTGRYPKVEVLAMYSVELHPNNDAKRAIVRWLESMPNLALIKLAQMQLPLVDALMEDPRQYDEEAAKPDTEEKPEGPHIVAPRLLALHATHVQKDVIMQLVSRRKQLGAPFQKFYVPLPLNQTGITSKMLDDIKETGADIRMIYNNCATDEEKELINRG